MCRNDGRISSQFMDLGSNEVKVASAIGVTEAVAVAVMRRKTLKVSTFWLNPFCVVSSFNF